MGHRLMGTSVIPGGATLFFEATNGVDAPIGRRTLLVGCVTSSLACDLTG